jgi:hypothetical protein
MNEFEAFISSLGEIIERNTMLVGKLKAASGME